MENQEATQQPAQQLNRLLDRMRTLRDDLRVRAHLGNMDLRDALRELEQRFDEAERSAVATLHELEVRFIRLGEKLASAEPLAGNKQLDIE